MAFVQSKQYVSSSSLATHSITMDAVPTVGNLQILAVVGDSTATIPSGWSVGTSAVDFVGLYIWYRVVPGSPSATTSVTLGGTTSCWMAALEYSNMVTPALDKTASNSPGGSPTSIATGTTAATTQADELLIAVAGLSHADVITVTGWSNSFVQLHGGNTTVSAVNIHGAIATRTVAATATYTTTATLSAASGNPSAAIATFKITAGAAAASLVPYYRPMRHMLVR